MNSNTTREERTRRSILDGPDIKERLETLRNIYMPQDAAALARVDTPVITPAEHVSHRPPQVPQHLRTHVVGSAPRAAKPDIVIDLDTMPKAPRRAPAHDRGWLRNLDPLSMIDGRNVNPIEGYEFLIPRCEADCAQALETARQKHLEGKIMQRNSALWDWEGFYTEDVAHRTCNVVEEVTGFKSEVFDLRMMPQQRGGMKWWVENEVDTSNLPSHALVAMEAARELQLPFEKYKLLKNEPLPARPQQGRVEVRRGPMIEWLDPYLLGVVGTFWGVSIAWWK